MFRTELARRSAESIVFVEANLDFSRATSEREERAFVEYLRSRFDEAPPDAVVTIGPPAARFYLRHRAELFPTAPVVVGALDVRLARQLTISPTDAVVGGQLNLPGLVENILRLLPETETIAVVVGTSELERFWRGEFEREFVPFAGRVKFVWFDGLSLAQMQERVANLPPRSAVLYGILIVDAAGVPHERQDGLASLHAVANAPIFGLYENELGKGVVGGPYSSQKKRGERIATAALRALGGPAGSQPQVDMVGFETSIYDWRELRRWNIDPARLPPDSEIRFKPPSIWEEHRVAALATTAALVLQAALIAALMLQRARRRRAEREMQHLGGRILTAQEDERRRLAREMHDDVTQRLAALAIDTAQVQSSAGNSAAGNALDAIRQRLVKLSEDVHALSYRLHPSMIEDLGLVAALRAECNRVAHQEPIRVAFDSTAIPKKVPPNTAICLFRVAQEALRNVVRHANARNVEVSLQAKEGGIALAVRDDGTGFGDAHRARASLGLMSMRERVHLAGGKLDIVSRPDRGTSIVAWVPLREAA
ncbi:MAG: sensor histidine kinase [Burkholderiales bacterium]|nr:sensor histidine kinase [Burkholderiales bacterium]